MSFIDDVGNFFKGAAETISSPFRAAWEGIEGVGKTIAGEMTGNEELKKLAQDDFKQASGIMVGAGEHLKSLGETIGNGVASVAGNIPLLGPALEGGLHTLMGHSEQANDAFKKYTDGRFLDEIPIVGTVKAGVEGRWSDFGMNLLGDIATVATWGFATPAVILGKATLKGVAKGIAKNVGENFTKQGLKDQVTDFAKDQATSQVQNFGANQIQQQMNKTGMLPPQIPDLSSVQKTVGDLRGSYSNF